MKRRLATTLALLSLWLSIVPATDGQAAATPSMVPLLQAPAGAACTPRPPVTVSSVRDGGALRVTIAAGPSAAVPNNRLSSLRLGTLSNATVEADGRPLAAQATLPLPGRPSSIGLLVRRADGVGAVTVPFTVTDDCGEWRSFVGDGSIGQASAPPTPTQPPAATPAAKPAGAGPGASAVCVPRPNVTVSVEWEGPGVRATISANPAGAAPNNRLVSLRTGAIGNAVLTMAGQPVAGNALVPLPGRPQTIVLTVRRSGDAGAVTVPLTVTDDCGDWQTFVGGGHDLFGPEAVPGQQCPSWAHRRYVATAPDGRQLPTWHPPTDPTYQCWFGHEHGDNPAGAPALRGRSAVFGYASARAGLTEAHNGYKVFRWDNVQSVAAPNHNGASLLMIVNQGTSDAGRFTSVYRSVSFDYYNAQDGREAHVQMMAPLGTLYVGCGPDDPSMVLTQQQSNVPGARTISADKCYTPPSTPYEHWMTALYVGLDGGGGWRAYIDPAFGVFNANTYCVVSNNACQLAYSDVRAATGRDPLGTNSLFKGTKREAYLNQVWLANAGNSSTVWTDPYGALASPNAHNAIPQFVASLTAQPSSASTVFGSDKLYDDGTVRAPN